MRILIIGGNGTSQNYITDVKVESNKLSCDGITMENHTGNVNKSTFSYGEKITFFYKNMTGFTLQNSLAYPDMGIFVTNKKGNTVMSQKNLFKDIKEGYTKKNLNLRSKLANCFQITIKHIFLLPN